MSMPLCQRQTMQKTLPLVLVIHGIGTALNHKEGVDGGLLFINCGNNIKNKPVYITYLNGAQLCSSNLFIFSLYMAKSRPNQVELPFPLRNMGYISNRFYLSRKSFDWRYCSRKYRMETIWNIIFLPGAFPELKVKVISLSDATIGNDV